MAGDVCRSIVYAEPEMLDACKKELDGVTEEYLMVAAEVRKYTGRRVYWLCRSEPTF